MKPKPMSLAELREVVLRLRALGSGTITVPQAAEWLHIGKRTIYRRIEDGNLETVRTNRRGITARSLLAYLKREYQGTHEFDFWSEMNL